MQQGTLPMATTIKLTSRPTLSAVHTETLYHPHGTSKLQSVTPVPFVVEQTTPPFIDTYTTNAIPTTTKRRQQIFVGDWSHAGIQAPVPVQSNSHFQPIAPRMQPPMPQQQPKRRRVVPKPPVPNGIRLRSPEGLAVGAGVTISSRLGVMQSATVYPTAPTAVPMYVDYTTVTDVPSVPTDAMYSAGATSGLPSPPTHATGQPGMPAPPAAPRAMVAQPVPAPVVAAPAPPVQPIQQAYPAAVVQHATHVQPVQQVQQPAPVVQPAATIQHAVAVQPVQQVQPVQLVQQVAAQPVQTVQVLQPVQQVAAPAPVQTVQTVQAVAPAPAPVQTLVAAPVVQQQPVQIIHHAPPGSIIMGGAPTQFGYNGTVRHHSREAASGNIINVDNLTTVPSAAVKIQLTPKVSDKIPPLSRAQALRNAVIDKIVQRVLGRLSNVSASVGDLFDFHHFLHKNTPENNTNGQVTKSINRVVTTLANSLIEDKIILEKAKNANKMILISGIPAVDGTLQRRFVQSTPSEKKVVYPVDTPSMMYNSVDAILAASSAQPTQPSVHEKIISNTTQEHFFPTATTGDANATAAGVHGAAAESAINVAAIYMLPIVKGKHLNSSSNESVYSTQVLVLNTSIPLSDNMTTNKTDNVTALTDITTAAPEVTTVVTNTTALPGLSTAADFTTIFPFTETTSLAFQGSSTMDPDLVAELLEAQEEVAMLAAEHNEAAARAAAVEARAMKSSRRRRPL